MAERILVRKIEPNLWQWRFVTSLNQWLSDSFYTGDVNLLAESAAGKTCWLLLDGRDVGTRRVDVGVKERKLLGKLVPFEVEESIVTPIDGIVFSYGPLTDGIVDVAYAQEAKTAAIVAELEAIGADVQCVSCDYLELDASNGWVLLQDENTLFVKHSSHGGFRCELENAQVFLLVLCQATNTPTAIYIIAENDEALLRLRSCLPEAIEGNADISIYEQEGGIWDVLALKAKPTLDFRTGGLARKLPFGQWWNEWKIPAIAASVAFAFAIGITWGELFQAKTISKQLFSDRDAVYRQVVPGGSITDPVRQLQGKLHKDENTQPSNVVALVAKITPEIRKNPDLKVTAFRYTQSNATLQFSVEAKEFAMLEALRGKMIELGLIAEIKRSSVSGDIHQAQITVSES